MRRRRAGPDDSGERPGKGVSLGAPHLRTPGSSNPPIHGRRRVIGAGSAAFSLTNLCTNCLYGGHSAFSARMKRESRDRRHCKTGSTDIKVCQSFRFFSAGEAAGNSSGYEYGLAIQDTQISCQARYWNIGLRLKRRCKAVR